MTKTIKDVKNYWDSRPCNASLSNRDKHTKEYFDEIEKRKYFTEPHIPAFAEFPKWRSKKVLEIGCGIGTDTVNFARAGANVAAVELSEESIKLAEERVKLYGLENKVKFYLGNAENLSSFVPVEQYDLVYSFGVIHHSPHPEKIFEEITKYLGPESVVKIMLYHKYGWPALRLFLKRGHKVCWNYGKFLKNFHVGEKDCPIVNKYSRAEVKKLMYGYKIKKFSVDHIFPYFRDKAKKGIYEKPFYFKIMPNFLLRLIERAIGWHLLITAKI